MNCNDNFKIDSENESRICILHTNDTHSYLDDFARRAYMVNKVRAENKREGIDTFLFDCGDVFAGNIYFMMYEGRKEAELMNLLKYDAMTLGNHEFDKGSLLLSNFIKVIDFPVVSANVNMSRDPYFKEYIVSSKNNLTHPKIAPFIIKKLNNGEEIAIFGLTTQETMDNASPSAYTEFKDPIESAIKTVQKIKKLGINKIILLSHLGKNEDQKLAETVDGIDIIMGGHSHTLLEKPIIVNKKESVTAIVQAGEYGKFLGKLTITFGNDGKMKNINGEVLAIDQTIAEDDKLKVVIDKIKKEKDKLASKIIGETALLLNGEREQLKLGETNLGNLVTDAFLYTAQENGFNPDIALMNGMGIRASIPKGPINFGDMIKVLPFSTTLMILELTGKEVKDSLEYGLFPQVSGLKVNFNLNNPEGERLTDIYLLRNGNFEPIEEEKNYIVATNSFVGIGKDNFNGFKTAKVINENIELDVKVLSDYISSLPQPIKYGIDNRMTYKK